jgi:uncharacterized protein
MRSIRTLTAAALALGVTASGEGPRTPNPETPMTQSILVHLTHGPEHPTRAALAFNVAHAAVTQGHRVTVFLAGDAVQLLRDGVLDHLQGLGTGTLRELYDGLAEADVPFYASAGSSAARGLSVEELAARGVEPAGPPVLVRLATEHDRMFTY